MKKMNDYKMRAECQWDVSRALMVIFINDMYVKRHENGDCSVSDVEVSFSSTMTLAELREKLAIVPDGHVMVESLNLMSKYTGERYFFGAQNELIAQN